MKIYKLKLKETIMTNLNRDHLILRHRTINLIVFFITGVVLLVSALVLLVKIYDFELASSQFIDMIFIFIIIFAVLGFGMIILGIFFSIKLVSLVKKMDIQFEEEIIKDSPQPARFQVIRPAFTSKTVEIKKKRDDTIEKTEKAEIITEEKIVEKPKKTEKIEKVPETAEKIEISDFSYEDGLQAIVDRYNSEKVKKAFKNWYNTMMITFPDISKSYLFKINGDESLVLSEGVDNEAAVQVKMDSTMFVKMMTKQINPIKAYSSGNMEVKGEMKNMLKLRKLMF